MNNYERISDHCSNIAIAVIEADSDVYDPHEYISKLRERNNNAKSKIKNCLHYRANYEEVLQQMMNQVAEAMSATNPL